MSILRCSEVCRKLPPLGNIMVLIWNITEDGIEAAYVAMFETRFVQLSELVNDGHKLFWSLGKVSPLMVRSINHLKLALIRPQCANLILEAKSIPIIIRVGFQLKNCFSLGTSHFINRQLSIGLSKAIVVAPKYDPLFSSIAFTLCNFSHPAAFGTQVKVTRFIGIIFVTPVTEVRCSPHQLTESFDSCVQIRRF